MTASALRAKCHAGVGRLERRVRQHLLGEHDARRRVNELEPVARR